MSKYFLSITIYVHCTPSVQILIRWDIDRYILFPIFVARVWRPCNTSKSHKSGDSRLLIPSLLSKPATPPGQSTILACNQCGKEYLDSGKNPRSVEMKVWHCKFGFNQHRFGLRQYCLSNIHLWEKYSYFLFGKTPKSLRVHELGLDWVGREEERH